MIEFITCLEVALRSGNTPRNRWKHALITQLTQIAKQPVLSLLDDDDFNYDEVKERLLSRDMTTSVAASEAFFSIRLMVYMRNQ